MMLRYPASTEVEKTRRLVLCIVRTAPALIFPIEAQQS